MAICLVASIVCGPIDDKQEEFGKVQKSLRDARLILEDTMAELDTMSRDDIIDSFNRVHDLEKEWVLNFQAHNRFDPSHPNYVKNINEFF